MATEEKALSSQLGTETGKKMDSIRKTAKIVGVLFIIATVGAMLSFPFVESLLESPDDPDYFINVSANDNQIVIGALLILIVAAAVVLIPVMMFPIFRKHNEALALGYFSFRVLEAVALIALVVGWLLLMTLSQEYVEAEAPDASYFQTSGALLQEAGVWINLLVSILLGLGALIFYYLLYQSKLIPRFLSVWGVIGAIFVLAAGVLGMFGSLTEDSVLGILLSLPIAVNEMVLAVWLIVKGFNTSAIASGSA